RRTIRRELARARRRRSSASDDHTRSREAPTTILRGQGVRLTPAHSRSSDADGVLQDRDEHHALTVDTGGRHVNLGRKAVLGSALLGSMLVGGALGGVVINAATGSAATTPSTTASNSSSTTASSGSSGTPQAPSGKFTPNED